MEHAAAARSLSKVAWAAFAALLLQPGLAREAAAQPIDISGVVKDSLTGLPLSGAVVSLAGKGLADTTDEAGSFRLVRAAARLADRSPLQRLVYTARHGFALRLSRDEQVVAEILNGAGRTVLRGEFPMAAGDWSLKPGGMKPGLYTVKLWTGKRLRALRLEIPAAGKGRGNPEWLLSRLSAEEAAVALAPPFGVVLDSLRMERSGYSPGSLAVRSWSQGGITLLPKPLSAPVAAPPAAPAAKPRR
jgi:hypothetical protein